MTYEGKKNTDKWFPVIFLDELDFKTPETGKAYSAVTVQYQVEGATGLVSYTVTTDDWKESGQGIYWLRIGASEFTSEAKFEVSIACSGCLTHRFVIEVRDKTIAELMDDVDSLLGRIPYALAIDANGRMQVQSGTNQGQIDLAYGQVKANVVALSDDTIAADNLEAILDGTGARMTLSQLKIVTAGTDIGIDINCTGGTGSGIKVLSNAVGLWVLGGYGGAGYSGARIGSNGGAGFEIQTSSAIGLEIKGTPAVKIAGQGTGHGIHVTAPSDIDTVKIDGAGTGRAVRLTAVEADALGISASFNGNGICVEGGGSGAGLKIVGGSTANGVEIAGGSTGGDGLVITAGDGDGVFISSDSSAGLSIQGHEYGMYIKTPGETGGTGIYIEGDGIGMEITGAFNQALKLRGNGSETVKIETTAEDGEGIRIVAAGEGSGIHITSEKYGIAISSNDTALNLYSNAANTINIGVNGDDVAGLHIANSGTGPAMKLVGGTSSSGVLIIGQGNAHGLECVGGGGTGSRDIKAKELTEIMGSGFDTGADSLEQISGNVQEIIDNGVTIPEDVKTAIADKVWDKDVNSAYDSPINDDAKAGRQLANIRRLLMNKMDIKNEDDHTYLVIYDDSGNRLYRWQLTDIEGGDAVVTGTGPANRGGKALA